MVIEMAAYENESVGDTLARARKGRDFISSLLPAHP
jgi:hypothetical protein